MAAIARPKAPVEPGAVDELDRPQRVALELAVDDGAPAVLQRRRPLDLRQRERQPRHELLDELRLLLHADAGRRAARRAHDPLPLEVVVDQRGVDVVRGGVDPAGADRLQTLHRGAGERRQGEGGAFGHDATGPG